MSQFPILDKDELVEGVNYLLSGPAGLGQNFEGFSGYTTVYSTGNFRPPFTQGNVAQLYTQPIALSNAERLDGRTWRFTFANTQPTAPFALGSPLSITDVNPSDYDGTYRTIGVVQCTTANVIARTSTDFPADPYVSGGNAAVNATQVINISEPLPLSISNIGYYSPGNVRITLTNTLASAPYPQDNGDYVVISGVSPDYDNDWEVWDSTTNSIDIKLSDVYPYPGGGYVAPDFADYYLSTDCNARVTVNGAQDRVFLTGQLSNIISYDTASGGILNYVVALNRYRGVPNNDPTNPDFRFLFDKTISQKFYHYSGLSGTGELAEVETVFATVIDPAPPNYYWYILEIGFQTDTDVYVSKCQLGVRCLSVQVVKE